MEDKPTTARTKELHNSTPEHWDNEAQVTTLCETKLMFCPWSQTLRK